MKAGDLVVADFRLGSIYRYDDKYQFQCATIVTIDEAARGPESPYINLAFRVTGKAGCYWSKVWVFENEIAFLEGQ